jgi:hypothetical protein
MATKFGPSQISNETPAWAKWMFRITFIVTTALIGWIAATNLFPQNTKYEITLLLKLLIDPIVYGISKMFGVDPKQEDA